MARVVAAAHATPQALREYLDTSGEAVDTTIEPAYLPWSALAFCVSEGHLTAVQSLLAVGANPAVISVCAVISQCD